MLYTVYIQNTVYVLYGIICILSPTWHVDTRPPQGLTDPTSPLFRRFSMGAQNQSVFFRFCERSSLTIEGFSILNIASSDSQRDTSKTILKSENQYADQILFLFWVPPNVQIMLQLLKKSDFKGATKLTDSDFNYCNGTI